MFKCVLPAVLALLAIPSFAQTGRVKLTGHVRPEAISANDGGRVSSSLHLENVILLLRQTDAQIEDLNNLVASQQDPASPNYHRWLTPEQYGARFGAAQADIDQVTAFLASHNLTVGEIARSRTTVTFSGNVRDVESAFGTEIHNFQVNGERHFANAGDPSLPAAVGGLVRTVHGLSDFRMKPRSLKPRYTSITTGAHYLSPQDVATIFDILPLYNIGITGKGQSIAVVGQTRVNLSDIQEFRSYFNLPAKDPQMVQAGAADPGITGDLDEANLDIEWAGAVARDASIIYVYDPDVVNSLYYVIKNNLAPVISMSYGECEQHANLSLINTWALQAQTQGMTWVAASGDNGANDCYGGTGTASGLSVDSPASTPGVTGIGGTTLSDAGPYWNAANSANHASALSYIPEVVWNDSVLDRVPASTGGGASTFFTKPSWQVGAGVPNDGVRDVPDIALPASADHDGYLVYSSGGISVVGGTSVGAPVFAGVAALLNQYEIANGLQSTPGQGNMNPRLYALAQAVPGIFHDVTSGNNVVTGCPSARPCSIGQVGYSAGAGYDQVTGLGSIDAYNLVAAWYQPNSAPRAASTIQLTSSASAMNPGDSTTLTATISSGGNPTPSGTVTFYAGGVAVGSSKVSGSGATVTASITATGSQLTSGSPEAGVLSDGSTTGVNAIITAVYGGDRTYGTASGSTSVTVTSPGAMVVLGGSNAASFGQSYAPGAIVALFGQNLASGTPDLPNSPLPTTLGGTTVTFNGIAAPLYYVSPTQINVQVPYEIPANSSAIIKVNANGQSATSQVPVVSSGPGIFGDGNRTVVPYQTTGRGQTVFLFATGDGLFNTPSVTTGSVPVGGTISTDPSRVIITVGGVRATPVFVGVPSWSIGVTQINFTISPDTPLGPQPVYLTVGQSTSLPAYVTVTP